MPKLTAHQEKALAYARKHLAGREFTSSMMNVSQATARAMLKAGVIKAARLVESSWTRRKGPAGARYWVTDTQYSWLYTLT